MAVLPIFRSLGDNVFTTAEGMPDTWKGPEKTFSKLRVCGEIGVERPLFCALLPVLGTCSDPVQEPVRPQTRRKPSFEQGEQESGRFPITSLSGMPYSRP